MKEHVWIPAKGRRISAMVHLSEGFNPERPLVVCCHGFTADKIGNSQLTVNLSRALAERGVGVLRFDYLGSGESDGEFATDTSVANWQADLNAVLDWVASQPQLATSPVVLYGHSLGGLIVLTHQDHHRRIAARVVFAPVIHGVENFRDIIFGAKLWQQARDGGTIANFLDKGFHLECQFVKDLIKQDYQSLEAAAGYQTPLLIVHGTRDAVVPLRGSQELFNRYNGDKEFVKLDVDHVATGGQPELYAVITGWLQRIHSRLSPLALRR